MRTLATLRPLVARATLALAAALGLAACDGHVVPPPGTPGAGAHCSPDDLAGCERAVLAAEPADVPAALARLDEASGGGSAWGELHAALGRTPDALVVVHGPADAAAAEARATAAHAAALAMPASRTEPRALVVAIGRAAGRDAVLFASERGPEHLYCRDALAPFALGLVPALAAARDPAALARELELGRTLDAAARAAAAFDYVTAARQAESLAKLASALPPESEPWLRARYLLNLLGSSGIELDLPEGATKDPRTEPPDTAQSSGYARLLAVLVSPTAAADGAKSATPATATAQTRWSAARAALAKELGPERLAQLDYMYAPEGTCPTPLAPPMDSAGDLLFAHRIGRSLDPSPPSAPAAAAPAEPAPPGTLPLETWLPRYESMVRFVETSGTIWALAASLVSERGELHGLRAEGTVTYGRVSELLHKHVDALRALAGAEPARFRPFPVLSLFYQRGLLADRRLRQAVIDFASAAIALKLQSTDSVTRVWEAAGAAFVAGLSLPGDAQSAQFLALASAVADKLGAGKLEPAHGWSLAGLHAAHGALRLVLGEPERARASLAGAAAALDGPDVAYRGLARLTMAAVHYVSLIGTGALDPAVANPEMFAEGRKKALAALRQALAELAPEGPATPEERDLLADTASLMDGAIVAIATSLAAEAPAGPSCAGDAASARDPRLRDAFERLNKTRRRLLERPAFRDGGKDDRAGPWLRRVRLVATVLSDAVDVADKGGTGVRFAIDDASAARFVEAALGDWEERDLAGAIAGGYGLARAALGAQALDLPRLKRDVSHVLAGLAAAFGSAGTSGGAASLFDALRAAADKLDLGPEPGKGGVGTGDLAALMVRSAAGAYDAGASAQGDVLLLGASAASAARKEALPREAAALAERHGRPVLIATLAYSERFADRFDPAPLVGAMQGLARQQCTAPSPDAVASVLTAFHAFKSGERAAARAALEAFLARAEARGLDVPRLNFAYQEATGGKIFTLQVGQSYARDLIRASGTFQIGLGMQTGGSQTTGLAATFADGSTPTAAEEAARYYAHVALVTAVYAWLDGDATAAARAARRAVDAYTTGVRLGQRRVDAKASTALWQADAATTLALAGQLAAEHGEAFLAGHLWSLVTFDEDVDDQKLGEFFAELPQPLRGIPALEAVRERARAKVRLLADRPGDAPKPYAFECLQTHADPKPFVQVGCVDYPAALGLRIANVLPFLPHLTAGAESGRATCAPFRPLDRFLTLADQHQYDPDAFTAAVQALRQGGHAGDAAVLLARHREPAHCGALVAEARALADRAELGTALRADLVTVAANCAGPEASPALEADLATLDELTKALATPDRNLSIVTFAARSALTGQPALLAALARKPDFVSRWLATSPELATAALLMHHAGYTLADQSFDALETLPYYRLLCTTYPPADRGPLCGSIAILRGGGSADERKRSARAALEQLLGSPAAP
ncbi:MAG: hypothetical protein IT373_07210 [Polyangiaceae bacterium]|nr:hypothetical protein [Polyangiaceae bacterium]